MVDPPDTEPDLVPPVAAPSDPAPVPAAAPASRPEHPPRSVPADPVLVAHDLRVDVDGSPACDGLSFRTTGERVLVLGAPRALFLATTGLLPVVRGALTVRGLASHEAAYERRIAGVPNAPPMPPKWTVTEYVEWSARLAGVPVVDARSSAQEAIRKLMLGHLAKTLTAHLVPHARRATVVAGALATFAQVIALDDPLGGLPDEVAATFANVLVAALSGRAWIVFAPRMSITSPLAMQADEAIVATPTRVDAQGTPAEIAGAERRFVGRLLHPTVASPTSTIAPAVAARGGRVEEHGAHAFFDLGKTMTTAELFAICAAADVALIELVPISRALT